MSVFSLRPRPLTATAAAAACGLVFSGCADITKPAALVCDVKVFFKPAESPEATLDINNLPLETVFCRTTFTASSSDGATWQLGSMDETLRNEDTPKDKPTTEQLVASAEGKEASFPSGFTDFFKPVQFKARDGSSSMAYEKYMLPQTKKDKNPRVHEVGVTSRAGIDALLLCRDIVRKWIDPPAKDREAWEAARQKANYKLHDVECRMTSACFPGQALFSTPTGSIKAKDLVEGQLVLTPVGYEPVIGFVHKSTRAFGRFLQIVYPGGRLLISEDHLVFDPSGASLPARDIKVGQSLVAGDESGDDRPVVVKEVLPFAFPQGFYAPITMSGTLIVDGLVVSAYASPNGLMAHTIAHWAMFPLRAYYSFITTFDELAASGDLSLDPRPERVETS